MAQINIQIEGMSIKEAQAVMAALTQSVADVDTETTAAPEKRDDLPPELQDDLPGDLGQEGKGPAKDPAPKKSKPKAAGKKKEPKPAEGDDNVVDLDEKRTGTAMEKLAKFTKLVDVIEVLREGGLTDDDALIAECERIKDQVPVLKKIPDLAGRVKRVLERLSA